MAEHRPESARQRPDHAEVLRCVTLPAIPTVYGLDDPDEGVTAWVLALPGGRAFIVSSDEESSAGVIDTSLDRVVRWWAPRRGTDLVLVTT
ncbi:MAG: hypothetical protein ACRDS0_15550 [Pseudonocardiaceae bacterium]